MDGGGFCFEEGCVENFLFPILFFFQAPFCLAVGVHVVVVEERGVVDKKCRVKWSR